MTTAATTIREGRARLGLTVRDLARLAGVAYPTVSRIEKGHEDPRWSTMERLTGVLGVELPVATSTPTIRLDDLARSHIESGRPDDGPDFTALRAAVDHLTLRPAKIAIAIMEPPRPSGSPVVDNILAAVAEKLADDAGIRRPRWTAHVEPLERPWTSAGTPAMRARHAAAAPAQFIARGVLIPAATFWRTTTA